MTELNKPVEFRLADLTATIKSLQNDIQVRDKIQKLESDNSALRHDLNRCNTRISALELYSRRDNLTISGLSFHMAEVVSDTDATDYEGEGSITTAAKVVKFCNDVLHANVDISDISVAHPLCPPRNPRPGSVPRPAVMVKFCRCAIRDEVFSAKYRLRAFNQDLPANKKVFVNEDLTDQNRRLLVVARSHVCDQTLKGAWTANCHIIIKRPNKTTMRVNSLTELANEINNINIGL